MKRGEPINSRRCYRRHGKTWMLIFNSKDSSFELFTLEKDEKFFASFNVEIADTIYRSEVKQFDRGIAWWTKLERPASELVVGEENAWKFIVTITPRNPTKEFSEKK